MKKKNLASASAVPNTIMHLVICAQCAAKIHLKQQDYSITVKAGRGSSLLHAKDMLRITVDGNYCVFETLIPRSITLTDAYRVRSKLSDWIFLFPYGFEQLSRNSIINVAHVSRAKSDRVYTHYHIKGMEVTESHKLKVALALKKWLGMHYVFSR
jgi:DNA-binding LytR/AlgR family response regulator